MRPLLDSEFALHGGLSCGWRALTRFTASSHVRGSTSSRSGVIDIQTLKLGPLKPERWPRWSWEGERLHRGFRLPVEVLFCIALEVRFVRSSVLILQKHCSTKNLGRLETLVIAFPIKALHKDFAFLRFDLKSRSWCVSMYRRPPACHRVSVHSERAGRVNFQSGAMVVYNLKSVVCAFNQAAASLGVRTVLVCSQRLPIVQ